MAGAVVFPTAGGRVVVGLVLLAAFTAPWTGIKLSSGGAPADVLIVLALGVVGVMVVFGDLRFSLPNWPLLPCTAIAICVLVRQIDPAPSYLRILRMQIYGDAPTDITKALFWFFAIVFVPTAIVACTAIEHRSPVWIMAAFAGGATVSCGVAITDLIGVTHIGRALGEATQICNFRCFNAGLGGRMNGLTDHPNTLGMTAALSIPLVIYFLATMRLKWIAAIALAVLFGGILASGSRGAQAAAPVFAIVSMLLIPSKGRSFGYTRIISVLGAALGGFAILALLPSNIRQLLFRVFDSSGNSLGSDSERVKLLRAAMADWRSHPVFGSGISHIVEAHNIYLQFLASGGVLLAMAMLVYFFLVLRQSWLSARQGVLAARFLTLSVATWLVLGLVENAITDRYLYYSVGCIAALAWAHSTGGPSSPVPPVPAQRTAVEPVAPRTDRVGRHSQQRI